jgi:DNA-binding GntR family transcriptional regulator
MVHAPVKKQIAGQLRARLLAGEWSNGTRLKEDALAESFQVSRTPIRDALLELTKEGYLRMDSNRGASVDDFSRAGDRHLFLKMRRTIECTAVRSSFARWTPETFRELDKILRHFRVAAEMNDLPSVISHDIDFHQFLVAQHAEDSLSVVWRPLMTTLALPYSRHRNLLESYAEHLLIFNLLQAGDLRGSLAKLRAHIQ